MNKLVLDCPKLIRFTELTEDEVFCTESAAKAGVAFENTSEVEDLVVLRYFGPEANPDAPEIGAHRKSLGSL
jgi:dihydroxyacid dehydratase/phosphogluconate dehydratase